MRILRKWDDRRPLRKWQAQAVRRAYAVNKADFLAVATPGSGKTDVALKIAHNFLTEGKAERIVVVAPTEHLKRQWAESAARCGIDIDPNWSNSQGCEASDYFGAAVTYQQVSFAPDLYDLNCERPTMVIFDEIHHAGDNLDWGLKLLTAFGNAVFRLSLSGTPFRNDDSQIPFVRYVDRKSQADFTYSYGEALADGVCRPVYFPTIEGNAAWIRGNGDRMNCSMLANLPRQKAAERLRAVLDADGDWLADVLQAADNRLTEIRLDGHGDAGGLVIAIDQYHAKKIAELLKVITNEYPVVAISDEENSSRLIQDFARSGNQKRWIVAVKMVSEGVDIPRLRVGVFASNVTSELYFRQAVGRFLRMIAGLDEQSAVFYLPADETLIKHALAIKEEREHYLPEIVKTEKPRNSMISPAQNGNQNFIEDGDSTDLENNDFYNPNANRGGSIDDLDFENQPGGDGQFLQSNSNLGLNGDNPATTGSTSLLGKNRNFIVPLSSEARSHDTIFDGSRFSGDELGQAEIIGKELGVKIPSAQVAAIIRRASSASAEFSSSVHPNKDENESSSTSFSPPVINNTVGERHPPIKSERKDKLRKRINQLANKLAHLTRTDFDEIHRSWIREMNGKPNRDATEEELAGKLEWLQNKISDFYREQTKR